jgi:excisionase family DNA binding protein
VTSNVEADARQDADGDRSQTEHDRLREYGDQKLLVTPEEAARRLSVGRTTVYELMARGDLVSVTIGRCRRIPVCVLTSFVDALLVGHPETTSPS